MLIARNNRIVSTPERRKCLYLYGGHVVYFNTEFGNLWCYRCQSIWKCDPPIILTGDRATPPVVLTGERATGLAHLRYVDLIPGRDEKSVALDDGESVVNIETMTGEALVTLRVWIECAEEPS